MEKPNPDCSVFNQQSLETPAGTQGTFSFLRIRSESVSMSGLPDFNSECNSGSGSGSDCDSDLDSDYASGLSNPADDAPLSLPERIGYYQLGERLGEGGMGAVYRATHVLLKREAAIKFIRRSRISPEALDRFARETEIAGQLSDAHLVATYDAGEVNGIPFLVMERLEGQTLAEYIATNGPVSPQEAIDIVVQAAQGLSCAHQAGLIHRDVKPGNIWITPTGTVKILDLGLSQTRESEIAESDDSKRLAGTPDFMAPEQANPLGVVDERADIYALGCVLFFLLTGRAPFDDPQHKTTRQKLAAQMFEPLPRLSRRESPDREASDRKIFSFLQTVLDAMTAKEPVRRYSSMSQTIDALERASQARSSWPAVLLSLCALVLLVVGLGLAIPRGGIIPGSSSTEPMPERAPVPPSSESSPIKIASEPQSSEPQSSEPQSSEPQSSEPQSSEPQSSEPQSSEPQSSEPQSSEPQSPEPQSPEPQSPEPQSSEPNLSGPKSSESNLSEDKSTAIPTHVSGDIDLENEKIAPEKQISVERVQEESAPEPIENKEIDVLQNEGANEMVHPTAPQTSENAIQGAQRKKETPSESEPSESETKEFQRFIAGASPLYSPTEADKDYFFGRLSKPGKTAGELCAVRNPKESGIVYSFRWCPPGTFTMGANAPELNEQMSYGDLLAIADSYQMLYGFSVADLQKRHKESSEEIRKEDYQWLYHTLGDWQKIYSDNPAHQVTLTHGFWMLETEVTTQMWIVLMGSFPEFNDRNSWVYSDRWTGSQLWPPQMQWPVAGASWTDCQDFCERLSRHLNVEITLPTEAQWEYACLAGKNDRTGVWRKYLLREFPEYPWNVKSGPQPKRILGYGGPSSEVIPLKPNDWGIYGMFGNVGEWTSDWYSEDLRSQPETDPSGPVSGKQKSYRGSNDPPFSTDRLLDFQLGHERMQPRIISPNFSFFRAKRDPQKGSPFIGLRVCVNVPSEKTQPTNK